MNVTNAMNFVSVDEFRRHLEELPPGVFLQNGPQYQVLGVPLQVVSKSAAATQDSVVLFIFHGALDQSKRAIPFFEHAYSPATECGQFTTVISVADPSLRLDKALMFTWYAGDHEIDTIAVLSSVVDAVYGLYPKSRFVFFGGSSGARPALALSHRIPDSWCQLINPLAFIGYNKVDMDRYVAACWPDGPNSRGTTIGDPVADLYRKGHSNWVLVLQNAFDKHLAPSILPFLSIAFQNSNRFILLSSFYPEMLRHDFPWPDAKVWRRSLLQEVRKGATTFERIIGYAMLELSHASSAKTSNKTPPPHQEARDLAIADLVVSTLVD